jgi:hypothetical protein
MRTVVLVCLVVGCSGPQTAPATEPIGNASATKQPSREAFVEEVVHALAAGDTDRLIALVDTKGMLDRAIACDGGGHPLADDDGELRRHARDAVARTKGSELALVELETGKRHRHKTQNARLVMTGEAVGDCTARTELLFHEVHAKVRMNRAGRLHESHLRIELLRADGRWFLAEIPRPSGMDSAMDKMVEFKDKLCACKEHDSKCAERVTDEMTQWSQEMARSASDVMPDDVTPEDAKRMADITRQMGECSMKAMTPAGP